MLLTTTTANTWANGWALRVFAALPTQNQPPGGGGNGGGAAPTLPGPKAPPGAGALINIAGYLQWGALLACATVFMGGIIAFTAGRIIDNRRYGNTGALMMLAGVGGALLFGIGPTIISQFSQTAG